MKKNIIVLPLFIVSSMSLGIIQFSTSCGSSQPPLSAFLADGTNWVGHQSGILEFECDYSAHTIKYTDAHSYIANNLEIPSYVQYNGKNFSVVTIEDNVFMGADWGNVLYGTLTLPETLITIGANAFCDQTFSGELHIPSSVKTIGEEAFGIADADSPGGFSSLYIDCDNSVIIADFAFYECVFSTITAKFDSEPSYIMGEDSFSLLEENGTVINTSSTYTSSQLLTFLKTVGLPDGWTI